MTCFLEEVDLEAVAFRVVACQAVAFPVVVREGVRAPEASQIDQEGFPALEDIPADKARH